jgi:glycyl-radical enzyme activating protein
MEQTDKKPRGLVFDIHNGPQRDGLGSRMTVYLKGCPLRCIWCRNPEGGSSRPEISFRAERCTECHSCAEICPEHVHHFDQQQHNHSLERDFCQACAQCVSKCPSEALRRLGEWMQVEQVLMESDSASLSGGLVLSGGEPMLQYTFARALLEEAKNRGIPTSLETCGYAARARYDKILPVVDIFYYDYKVTNPNDHAVLTGASNRAILSNLDFLIHNGAQVVLRCPMIPGINDTPEHMAGIAAISRRYSQLAGIEVIPYREGGTDKANQVGRHPLLQNVKLPDEDVQAGWISSLHNLGCEKARLY